MDIFFAPLLLFVVRVYLLCFRTTVVRISRGIRLYIRGDKTRIDSCVHNLTEFYEAIGHIIVSFVNLRIFECWERETPPSHFREPKNRNTSEYGISILTHSLVKVHEMNVRKRTSKKLSDMSSEDISHISVI